MPTQDEEMINSLEEQGVSRDFSRQAVRHLRSKGIEPDTVDIAAEHDRTLHTHENMTGFRERYPGENAEHVAQEYSEGRIEHMQGQQDIDYVEHRRHSGYTPRHGQLPARGQLHGSQPLKRQTPTQTEFDRDVEAANHPPGHEPELLTRIKSKYNELREGHQRRVTAAERERAYASAKRLESESKRLGVVRTEARTRNMTRERKYLEKQGRAEAVRQLPFVGGYMADRIMGIPTSSNRGNRGYASRTHERSNLQRLMFSGSSRLYGRSEGSMAMRLLGLQPEQKAKYVTVMHRGRLVRVPIGNPQGTAPGYPQEAQQSNFMQLVAGGARGRHEESTAMRLLLGGHSGRREETMAQRLLLNDERRPSVSMGHGVRTGREAPGRLHSLLEESQRRGAGALTLGRGRLKLW